MNLQYINTEKQGFIFYKVNNIWQTRRKRKVEYINV